MLDDIGVVPHGLKLSSTKLIMGLVVNKDEITFAEWVRVDVTVIVGFQMLFGSFNVIEGSTMVLVCLFQGDQALFQSGGVWKKLDC
jgi:hypothetical protein